MRIPLLAAGLALAAPLVFAADFWQEKDPSQWNDKDVKRLLSHSPWAREADVESKAPAKNPKNNTGVNNPDRLPGTRPTSGMGNIGGGGRGGRGGRGNMGGINQPRMPSGGGGNAKTPPKVLVRWQSGAAMIDAAQKREDKDALKLAEWSKEFYVVVASAGPLLGKNAKDADAKRVQRAADRLQPLTSLRIKGKEPLTVARTEAYMSSDGPMVAFLFSRSDAISLDSKEVEFVTTMGANAVKAKFSLKDMVRKDKLEL